MHSNRPRPTEDDADGSIAALGEFGLIEAVTRDLPAHQAVLVGPGDDGAVLDLAGPVVCSTDTLVEGVHFRRDWSVALDVGRKAVAVNVADIEAMGARPTAVLVSLSTPGDLPASWAKSLSAGIRAECDRVGAALIGGDTTRGRDISITVTILGELAGQEPVLRSGARPGQVVALRGRTGWAAAGLAVLGRGFRSPRAVVEAQRVPEVPYGAGIEAAEAGAGAMIDVSDGLLADLGHVARASAVRIDLDSAVFEVPEPLQAVAAATGSDPLRLILTGGEDHALAATFDPDRVPDGWLVIGTVSAAPDAPEVLVDGAPWDGEPGHDHFSR
ncbi:MAG: thiamine-phosphate kinase [Propionibacteriaceae bacterium]